jgi:hypothetical protein
MRRSVRTLTQGGLAAMAAIALALTACGGATSPTRVKAPINSAIATATLAPRLNWRALPLPAGVGLGAGDSATSTGSAISPVSARVAWVCAPAGGTGYQIWRTQDEGASWSHMSDLTPNTSGQPLNGCAVRPNETDTNALSLNISWGVLNAPNATSASLQGSQAYYSVDGGAHWKTLPSGDWLDQTVTVGATTYALLLHPSGGSAELVASADQLATWRDLPTPDSENSPMIQAAAAPTPGQPDQLLWMRMNGGASYSNDGGAHWSAIPPPAAGAVTVTRAQWLPQNVSGSAGVGWLVCGYLQTATAQQPTKNLCTTSLGKTWTSYPVLPNSWDCGHCAQGGGASSGTAPCLIATIGPGGALYADCGLDPQDSGDAPIPWTISRIAPGATTWTDIGQSPCQNSLSMTQTGQAWCVATSAGASTTYILDQLP